MRGDCRIPPAQVGNLITKQALAGTILYTFRRAWLQERYSNPGPLEEDPWFKNNLSQ
jgi:hypothetical protein